MATARLVLGTRNEKKRRELEELLLLPGLELLTLASFPSAPEVEESGSTFLENAALKAKMVSRAIGEWVLGEDSGLCVDALGGAPGIYSARYAGEPSEDERNNDKLLAELAKVPMEKRTAHYVCAAVIADPHGKVHATVEGECKGRILTERHGDGGFGYDPLFLIESEKKTFGELPTDFKQKHSHRAHAMRRLRPALIEVFHLDIH